MAWMKSFASVGDLTVGVSLGVGGKEGKVVEMGVGRDGAWVGSAIGSVRDNLFEFREVVEADRVERAPKDGGGDSKASSVSGGGSGMVSDLESLDTCPLRADTADSDLAWPGALWVVRSSILR